MPRTAPTRRARVLAGLAGLAVLAGCAADRRETLPGRIAAAATPLLALDPDADWTACYNRLVEIGPPALDWILAQPAMARPAAPDDLMTLTHTSLAHLLAHPASRPRISASVYVVTLDLLHFTLRVDQAPLGPVCMSDAVPPASWVALFPADFDHERAGRIDVEADRQALLDWRWRARFARTPLTSALRLRPEPDRLWPLLARRLADRWDYSPNARTLLTSDGWPQSEALLHARTHDYNLVRAACIALGARADGGDALDDLLALTDNGSPIVAYNARFALCYSPNALVRRVARELTGRD